MSNKEAIDKLAEALKKSGKYRWHDLRKYPNDLPMEDVYVDVFCNRRQPYDMAKYSFKIHGGWIWTNGAPFLCDIVAWKEIEPFEEVSE